MLSIIALLPGFLAAYIALVRSPQQAFLSVYLPCLLLLPDYYRWIAPGLPDPTFSQAAVVGVAAVFFLRGAPGYRFSFTDVLVFGFAFSVGYSEYLASGYSDAQNLIFNMLAWVILPYLLAKSLVEPAGLRVVFAQRIVWLLFVLAIISVYEFKFGMTPWRRFLDPFFPGQGRGWVTTFRWGFARVAGPYGHAILAGIVFVIGYRLQRWLEWSGAWEPKIKHLSWLPLTKARLITLGVLGGALMTMVRGPWIGGFLGAIVVAIGRARNRAAAAGAALALLVAVGVPAGVVFIDYVSVGRENAETVAQESAAYRWELIQKYMDIALEKSTWGWGVNDWPKVKGMPSIDNYYLLLFLMHGLMGLGFLVTLFLYQITRLFIHTLSQPPPQPSGSSLGFTLLGIYVAIAFSIATVFMGLQVMPLLFIITGWTDGYLRSGLEGAGVPQTASAPALPFRFRRVLT